jgi:hypothetical protein
MFFDVLKVRKYFIQWLIWKQFFILLYNIEKPHLQVDLSNFFKNAFTCIRFSMLQNAKLQVDEIFLVFSS